MRFFSETWEVNDARSILSAAATKRIQAALDDRGFVFGWQMYFRNYETGSYVVFDSWEAAREEFRQSMGGDRFTLYSWNHLPQECVLGRFDPAKAAVDDGQVQGALATIRSVLDRKNSEIIYILDQGSRDGRELDYACGPFCEDDWSEQIDEWTAMSGELLVLDESKLGVPWVDLWRPNGRGRVPTSGFTVSSADLSR